MNINSLSVIFPIYNEQKRISKSLIKIDNFLKKKKITDIEIILVNDGSTDRTSFLIKKFINRNPNKKKFKYLYKKENMGKGYALMSGIKIAKKNWILTIDIDLSVNIEELLIWERKYLKKNNLIYFGSRSHNLSKVKKNSIRNILGIIFKFLNYFLFNLKISDTQCGFKLYKNNVAKDIFKNLKQYGYIHDIEIACRCLKKKHKIIELPVKWVHKPNGKINLFTDPIKMFLDLIILKYRSKY